MTEKDPVFSGKVKQTGVFDFKELYRFCFTWLVDKGYFVVEKNYSEKINPNGKEVEIKWEASRKVSDYFRFSMNLDWRIIGLTSVEVEENGKKTKMDKGNPEIKITAVLEKDYESKWESSPFQKFLRGIYDRYIIRTRIEAYEFKIYQEANELASQIKSFLSLQGNMQ